MLTWPSERMSWQGFFEFVVGGVGVPLGVLVFKYAGESYREPWAVRLFAVAAVALVAAGAAVYRIARRGEYPWLIAIAAIALPLFDPSVAPYTPGFRVVVGFKDLLLVAAVVWWLARALAAADELERRVHHRALGFSYAAAIVVLTVSAEAADVVHPRGSWIASAMLATWFVSWLVLAFRYQR